MTPIDLSTMSPAEVEAEAKRRQARRAAGLPLEGVVLEGNPAPRSAVREAFMGVASAPQSFTVTLPWAALVSDNDKYRPVILQAAAGRRQQPKQILTPRYRKAKAQARHAVEQALALAGLSAPVFPRGTRLQFNAVLCEPDRSRDRDVLNFAKLVQDALTRLVYADDSQIDVAIWSRAPVPWALAAGLKITVSRIG